MSNHKALNVMASTVETISGETYAKVTTSPVQYEAYETASLQPGTSADGYDVKVTGSMFATVTTSLNTIVKNRSGNSGVILVYLLTDNSNPIALAPGESIIVDNMALVNLFLDTDATFGAMEYVDVVLFG